MPTRSLDAATLWELARAITATGRAVRLRPTGTSMAPAIRAGDEVTIAPVDPAAVAVGDIVAVGGARPRIHRVSARRAGLVVTCGDACASADSPVSPELIVGRVTRVDRPLAQRARRLAAEAAASLWRVARRVLGGAGEPASWLSGLLRRSRVV
jgi:hypothetical protein